MSRLVQFSTERFFEEKSFMYLHVKFQGHVQPNKAQTHYRHIMTLSKLIEHIHRDKRNNLLVSFNFIIPVIMLTKIVYVIIFNVLIIHYLFSRSGWENL